MDSLPPRWQIKLTSQTGIVPLRGRDEDLPESAIEGYFLVPNQGSRQWNKWRKRINCYIPLLIHKDYTSGIFLVSHDEIHEKRWHELAGLLSGILQMDIRPRGD